MKMTMTAVPMMVMTNQFVPSDLLSHDATVCNLR